MAAHDFRDFVERVRTATDIVGVVSEYVALKKSGARFVGLCPFHPEKTPSFSVNGDKQLFYCFGCQTGGDVFKFVMLYEKTDFPETSKMLGERAGIEPPRRESRGPASSVRDGLLEVHKSATEFFRKSLHGSSQGAPARKYLEKRGLTKETIEELGVGYAPDSWESLKSHLLGKRFPPNLLAKSGLFSARNDGTGHYDRFRGRVTFPILSVTGKAVGFGGRLVGDGEPKYLNSPESPIYTKGEQLYGLYWTRDEIRRAGEAVVVEGYLDFAALWEAGIRNCVATLGTAFATGQARLLARYTNVVTVNYDPDAAGMAAAMRSLDMLLSRGFTVRVLRLEDGLDPDDFVRSRGADAYREALASAPGYVDFLIDQAMRGRDLTQPRARVEALNMVLPHIVHIDNAVERSGLAPKIAEGLGIEDDLVLQEMKKALRSGKPNVAPASLPGVAGGASEARVPEAELRLVHHLLESAEARERVSADLSKAEIDGMAASSIIRELLEIHREGVEPTVGVLMGRLPEGAPQDLLTRIAFNDGAAASADDALLCLATVRRSSLVAERRRIQKEIDSAGASGAAVQVEQLQRKQDLSRRIDELS